MTAQAPGPAEQVFARFLALQHQAATIPRVPNFKPAPAFYNKAPASIEDHNKQKLENVFRNIDFESEPILGDTKSRSAILKHMLEEFNSDDMNEGRGNVTGAPVENEFADATSQFSLLVSFYFM